MADTFTFTSTITGESIEIEICDTDIIVDGELRRVVRDVNGEIPEWAIPSQSNQEYIRITPDGKAYGKTGREVKTLQSSGRYIIQGLDSNKRARSISLLKGLAVTFLPAHVERHGWPQCELKMPLDITTIYSYINEVKTSNGYGVNSHKRGLATQIDGKRVPGYKSFQQMHHRCTPNWISKNPCYNGCYVVDEWVDFQDFKVWYDAGIYEIKSDANMQIDKDLLGFKYYSPDTCVILPGYLNVYISNSTGRFKGALKQGNGWQAQCSIFNSKHKQKYLGYFSNPDEAHKAWAEFKNKQLQEVVIPFFIDDVEDEYKDHPMVLKVVQALKEYKFV